MIKDRVTVTIDHDVNEKIRKLSKDESRSFSQMINKILKEYIENFESK